MSTTNFKDIETAEVLLQAADLLEEKGWCREAYVDDAGRHCAVGAIQATTPGWIWSPDVLDPLEEHLGVLCILGWNDDKARNQEQVVSAFRRTAERLLT